MTITGPSLGGLFTAAWLSSLTVLTSLCTCPELPAVVFTCPEAVLSASAKPSPFSNRRVVFDLIANCIGHNLVRFGAISQALNYRDLSANSANFFTMQMR